MCACINLCCMSYCSCTKMSCVVEFSVISSASSAYEGRVSRRFSSCGSWDTEMHAWLSTACEHYVHFFVHSHMAVVLHYAFLVPRVNWPLEKKLMLVTPICAAVVGEWMRDVINDSLASSMLGDIQDMRPRMMSLH